MRKDVKHLLTIMALCYLIYSKTCEKRPLKIRQNKDFNENW